MAVVRDDILATIGAVIVGFGITAFVFRIQRELQQDEAGRVSWIPWADRLLIGVVTVAILLVLFPIALAGGDSRLWAAGRLPAAACSGSVVALAGYIPALLAHYRFLPRRIWPGLNQNQRARLVRAVRDELTRRVQPGVDLDELLGPAQDELDRLAQDERVWLVRDVSIRLDPDKLASLLRDERNPDELPQLLRGELSRLARGERKPGEPVEKAIVAAAAVLGMIAAVVSIIVTG